MDKIVYCSIDRRFTVIKSKSGKKFAVCFLAANRLARFGEETFGIYTRKTFTNIERAATFGDEYAAR